MLSISGFNGFKQINSLVTLLSKNAHGHNKANPILNLNAITEFFNSVVSNRCFENLGSQIVFSWSYCVVYYGDSLWVCGFVSNTEDLMVKVQSPTGLSISQVCCKKTEVICVTVDGQCWLYNLEQRQWKDLSKIINTEQSEESEVPERVKKVCSGETVTVALTRKGEVYNIPNKITLSGIKIVNVACGRSHILMLSDRGEVYSVGEGSRGQLGHGELEDEEQPRLVEGLAGLKVVAVACGGWHSCALTTDGDLYSWGWNMAGQLGITSEDSTNRVSVEAVPRIVDWPIGEEVRVSKVACGTRHTLTLLDDGSVWGCGWNAYGQLALSNRDSVDRMTKLTTHSSTIKDIICGHWNSCLVT